MKTCPPMNFSTTETSSCDPPACMAQKPQLLVQYLSLSESAMVLQQTVGAGTAWFMLLGFHTGPDEKIEQVKMSKYDQTRTHGTQTRKSLSQNGQSLLNTQAKQARHEAFTVSWRSVKDCHGLKCVKFCWYKTPGRLYHDILIQIACLPDHCLCNCDSLSAQPAATWTWNTTTATLTQSGTKWHKVTQCRSKIKRNKVKQRKPKQRPVHQLSLSSERRRGHGPGKSSSPRCNNKL